MTRTEIKKLIEKLEKKIEAHQFWSEQEQLIHQAYWYGRYAATEENQQKIKIKLSPEEIKRILSLALDRQILDIEIKNDGNVILWTKHN